MHTSIYVYIYITKKILQIRFHLTVLTMSFFQYLIIKKMAAIQCALDSFTNCTSQCRIFTLHICRVLLFSRRPAGPSDSSSQYLAPHPSVMPFSGGLQL